MREDQKEKKEIYYQKYNYQTKLLKQAGQNKKRIGETYLKRYSYVILEMQLLDKTLKTGWAEEKKDWRNLFKKIPLCDKEQ